MVNTPIGSHKTKPAIVMPALDLVPSFATLSAQMHTSSEAPQPAPAHQRRVRYRGKNPRAFDERYKEHAPEQFPETIEKVLASGRTPAGSHRPIMLAEILEVLAPAPGDFAVDCTLGYGGHAEAILPRLAPGGHLLGLDADPIEGPRTEARLQAAGFGQKVFSYERRNFAGLAALIAQRQLSGAQIILADLGVSSMQLDAASRGHTTGRWTCG